MPSNPAEQYYKEKRALIWACLLPATALMLIGAFTNVLQLWAIGLFISAPGFAGVLIYFDERRRYKKRLEHAFEDAFDAALLQTTVDTQNKQETHRCRLYRLGEPLTEGSNDMFVEVWDVAHEPRPSPPNGELIHTIEDSSMNVVREKMTEYELDHEIDRVGDWSIAI